MTILLAASLATLHAQLAVGKWRDHLSYNELFAVVQAGDRIYCSGQADCSTTTWATIR